MRTDTKIISKEHKIIEDKTYFFIKLFLFIITFSLTFTYLYLQKITYFYFDSCNYWNISQNFLDVNFNFSFLNFFDNLRGYSFPFIIFCVRVISDFLKIDNILAFNIYSSLLFSLITCLLLPLFFEKIFNLKFNIISNKALYSVIAT